MDGWVEEAGFSGFETHIDVIREEEEQEEGEGGSEEGMEGGGVPLRNG